MADQQYQQQCVQWQWAQWQWAQQQLFQQQLPQQQWAQQQVPQQQVPQQQVPQQQVPQQQLPQQQLTQQQWELQQLDLYYHQQQPIAIVPQGAYNQRSLYVSPTHNTSTTLSQHSGYHHRQSYEARAAEARRQEQQRAANAQVEEQARISQAAILEHRRRAEEAREAAAQKKRDDERIAAQKQLELEHAEAQQAAVAQAAAQKKMQEERAAAQKKLHEERVADEKAREEEWQAYLAEKCEAERKAARKKELRGDRSVLYRHYYEYLTYFPIRKGQRMNQYCMSLLANRKTIGIEPDSDAGLAIQYAKDNWELFLTNKDQDKATKWQKEKLGIIKANAPVTLMANKAG
jgi:hypothetical protein